MHFVAGATVARENTCCDSLRCTSADRQASHYRASAGRPCADILDTRVDAPANQRVLPRKGRRAVRSPPRAPEKTPDVARDGISRYSIARESKSIYAFLAFPIYAFMHFWLFAFMHLSKLPLSRRHWRRRGRPFAPFNGFGIALRAPTRAVERDSGF